MFWQLMLWSLMSSGMADLSGIEGALHLNSGILRASLGPWYHGAFLLQAGATAAGTAVQTLKGAGLTAAKTVATQAVSGRRHLLTQSVTVSTLANA